MLKRALTATCLVVLAASVAMAQTPPAPSEADQQKPATQTPQYDRPQTDKPSTDRGRSMTWTGCLQKATEGTGFVLTNVTATAGTSGTPSTTAPATASSYRLIGSGGQDLTKHVGHKIEVSGSVAGRMGSETKGTSGTLPGETPSTPPPTVPETPPTTTPPETTPPSPAASPMAGKDDLPRLNVKAIKHVSETCP